MSAIKRIHQISFTTILFVTTITCGGVYATFNYAQNEASHIDHRVNIGISEFHYLFPDTPDGNKQERLLNNILNGTAQDPDEGLNHPNSHLNQVIENRSGSFWGNSKVVGSMDAHEDFSNLFDEDMQDMSFLLWFSDNELEPDTFYLFTTSVPLDDGNGNPTIPYGEWVEPVYRTILKKNAESGDYEAVSAQIGKAKSMKYKNYLSSWLVTAPSFDQSSWVPIS